MLGDERLELAGEVAVTSERQVGLDPVLERRETQLLESHDGRLGERLVREVGKSRAAPEAQRLAKTACCALCITRRGGGSGACRERLEAVQIQLIGLELDDVTGGTGRDGVGPEHLAQIRDEALEHDLHGVRRLLPPKLIDEALARHHLVCVQQKEGEHRALLRAAECKRPSAVPRLERSKNSVVHRSAGTLARPGAAAWRPFSGRLANGLAAQSILSAWHSRTRNKGRKS